MKRYGEEFKFEAVKHVIDSGLPIKRVAKELGISDSGLGKWVRAYKANGAHSFPGSGKLSPDQQKIKELEKQLRWREKS